MANTFEILEHIGIIGPYKGGQKELNIVKWGDEKPKFDIRAWTLDHELCTKGKTFSFEEIKKLYNYGYHTLIEPVLTGEEEMATFRSIFEIWLKKGENYYAS